MFGPAEVADTGPVFERGIATARSTMSHRRTFAALAGLLFVAGCQSSAQMLAAEQATASQTAERRGQFELNCPKVTTTVLSSSVLQPVLWGGRERAEYMIGVAGCEQRRTYVVVCALGTQDCFAAAGR